MHDGEIDKLNQTLNSRTQYHDPSDRRRALDVGEHKAVDEKWNSPQLDEMLRYERRQPEGKSFVKRLFIFALIFFVIAAGAAGYIYLAGGNFISSKNVEIAVDGPVTLSAGEPMRLNIVVSNKNNADLETAELSIRFPDGTRDVVDTTKSLLYKKLSLGVINSGEQISTTTSAVLYGEKGETKDITLSLEYTVKGSNATFSKEKDYQVSLGTTPLTLTITQPESAASNDSFTTKVDVVSNSNEVLKNVIVQGEYPYGFIPTDATPAALNQAKNLWNLGDLSPGDKKTITIRGTLSGQDGEERTFRFSSGVAKSGDPSTFNTLSSAQQTVSINRPQVSLALTLNGEDSTTYTAPSGRSILGNVHYQSNLSQNLEHAQIVVKLSGAALDKFSVVPQNNGFYDSANNQIVWNDTSNPELSELAPGASGLYSFQFASLTNLPANSANQAITITTTLSGSPIGESPLSVKDTRSVKIGSQVTLTGQSLYFKGPFKNSGPIPPKAEKPTTYTVTLTLKDTQNDVTSPKLTAYLGSNVKWLSQVSPATENVVYNDADKSIVWSFDKLVSGAGFSAPAKTVSFQLSLTPSIGQIGSTPILLNNISFAGKDAFTNQQVSVTIQPVTTLFDSDSKYVQGDERVVK